MASVWPIKVEGGADALDEHMARRALALLIAPGERHEIRSLPGGRSRQAARDDLDAAIKDARSLDGTLYYSLNPIKAGVDRARKGAIARRAWMLIDVDPVRPPDVCATEEEKAKAAGVVSKVLDDMESRGWPAPLVIDSGNGWHLLYKIDLADDEIAKAAIRKLLNELGDAHDVDDAKIDRKVHDASRVSKLPGSWSRKGLDLPDRPHRPCVIAYEPSSLDVVPFELIKSYGKPAARPTSPLPDGAAWNVRAGSKAPTLANYVKSAIDKECIAVSIAPPGGRNDRLNVAAFNLGQFAAWPEMDSASTVLRLERMGSVAGLSDAEIKLTVKSGWEAGRKEPRPRPQPQAAPASSPQGGVEAARKSGKSPLKYAATVTPKKIEFLWPGRIPLGKLTTFAGHGGLGKTFVLCDIAARISNSLEWPMSGGELAPPGDVLFISGEDDEDDTLVPRLIECGADLGRVAFLSDEFNDAFSLVDLSVMEEAIRAMNQPKLIVIDPPTNYLEGVDDHKNAELRSAVLRPLARFARIYKVAIVLNNHVNKSSGKDVEAACRVMGSVAWVNGVRTAYLFVRDEGDPEKVVIAPIKTNVGKFPPAVTYKIVDTGNGMARVEWLDESLRSADQVGKASTSGARAAEWLTRLFRDRREWLSDEVKKLAKEAGISNYSLFESKEVAALSFRKKRRTGANGDVFYVWIADPGWPSESSESSESKAASHCGDSTSVLSDSQYADQKPRSDQNSDASLVSGRGDVVSKSSESTQGESLGSLASQLSELSEDSGQCGKRPAPGTFTNRAAMDRLLDSFLGN